MENTFGNFLYNNQNTHRNVYADSRFDNSSSSDRTSNRQADNRDTHNPVADSNGADNKRSQSGRHFEQVLERNFREAFEAEFRQKQNHNTLDFLKQHWFKIGLVVALLFFILKKDITKNFISKEENIEKIGKKSNKLTIASNKTSEDTPLSIGGTLTTDGNKSVGTMPELDEAVKKNYLKRFAPVAISERRKFGVPASLILANAMRQSFAGQRGTTAKLNNHFGLPCTYDWAGATASSNGQCWRQYENAWVSFRDHSVFVTTGKFADLKRLTDKDYKAWAKGLQRLGYPSSNDNLANELIDIVEQYGLQQLDNVK
ncbi:MAG: glucosaminidase domain-containing protein [Saprospiraceae bacterium]|nr:glucosaminidase domain-containing protein [Saprospiraceae bacterium]